LRNLLANGKRSASVYPMKTQIKIREAKQNGNEALRLPSASKSRLAS
jgi:hypothetical protein